MRKGFAVAFAVAAFTACADPSGLTSTYSRELQPVARLTSAGVVKQAISGTISFIGGGTAGSTRATPSGQCFFYDVPVFAHFEGDVAGNVTFFENERAPCDFSHLTGVGPFSAQVEWNGRSGTINGSGKQIALLTRRSRSDFPATAR